jgi:hypothetical protein
MKFSSASCAAVVAELVSTVTKACMLRTRTAVVNVFNKLRMRGVLPLAASCFDIVTILLPGKYQGRDHVKTLGIYGRVILKLILNK